MKPGSSSVTETKSPVKTSSASSRLTVVLTAAVAALGGAIFGYDTSVISGAMLFLRRDFHLSDVQLEFAVGIALAGALAGAALAGYCTDRWGRRWMLLMTAIGFGVFSLLSGLAVGLVSFSIARFFVGVCIGVASLTVPLYISEMSPARIRGALVSLNQLAIGTGIGVAYFVDYAFAASESWRWMFASAVFPAIVLVVGMIFLPESPRWLARKGFREKALENFHRLGRGDEAEAELAEVESVLQEEQEGLGILLRPGFRVAVLVGVGLAIFQQITGINTIIYYSPAILQMSGYPSAKAAILAAAIIGLANIIVALIAIAVVDHVGRRFMLLLSTAGMTVALASIGAAFHQNWGGTVMLYVVIGYCVAFGIGLGPVMWLLISEIYPTKIRGKAMSLATLSVWGANWLVAVTFLTLLHRAGPARTFWLYGSISVAAFIFCYVFVPETKGRTLEQIEHHWQHFGDKP
jgi:SP family galactose:H+ symporter-like MFS transporter